jgi:hypothetical protein
MAGEESKQLSKPDSLSQKLLDAVRSAVELQIVTQVGDVAVSGTLDKYEITFAPNGNAIATSINLVQGDITSVVPEKFWAPDQQVVRDFHQAQVEQAKSIVERNLRLIAEFGKQVADAITELKRAEKS